MRLQAVRRVLLSVWEFTESRKFNQSLKGGWKKKLLTFSIVASLTGYIYYYTIIKMSRDSFYAELEHAEHMERLRKGTVIIKMINAGS